MLTNGLVASKFGLRIDQAAINSVTRGLVGNSSFAVLPNVTPRMTFILTIVSQVVSSSIRSQSVMMKLTFGSLVWSNSLSNLHGKLSSALLPFVATRLFCLAGMYTRKLFFW